MKLPKEAKDALRQMPGWTVTGVWNAQVTVHHESDDTKTFTFSARDRIANTLATAEKLVADSTLRRAPKRNRGKSVRGRAKEDAAALDAAREKFAERRAAEISRESARRAVIQRERELRDMRRLMMPGRD